MKLFLSLSLMMRREVSLKTKINFVFLEFEINEEGRQFLSQLRGPLGIVAVAGMYRTGKSYLLNRMLLNRSDGFGVGPTINPCTKGVWMWSRPVEG
jgi:hypothetical protein